MCVSLSAPPISFNPHSPLTFHLQFTSFCALTVVTSAMNYPYGLQPRSFHLSKREWATTALGVPTKHPASTPPLALTDGTSHTDTVPHHGRTQIRPQPPSTFPTQRDVPHRTFMSVTDWSVSAGDDTNAGGVYKPRKPHHLPPIGTSQAPRAHRSTAARAESLIRANQQAALHYEQALEAAERETLENVAQRERLQLDVWQQSELTDLIESAPTTEANAPVAEPTPRMSESIQDRSFHTLYTEEYDAWHPRTSDEQDPTLTDCEEAVEEEAATKPAEELPALCGCHNSRDIDVCRQQLAYDLVDDLLHFREAEAETEAEVEVEDAHAPAPSAESKREEDPCTTNTSDPPRGECGCATTCDMEQCRIQQAKELVAHILAGSTAGTPVYTPEEPEEQPTEDDLIGLRRFEAETLVDDLLASLQPLDTHVCHCASEADVRSCRQAFLSAMVDDALAIYI